MKYRGLLYLVLFLALTSCDKKIKEYEQISLLNNAGNLIPLHDIESDYQVFAFLSPECPLSENYTRTLMNFQDSLSKKGIEFFYVFPGTFYPRGQIQVFAKTYNLPIDHFLYDDDYLLRNYCQASTTPEVFLLDNKGFVYYSGAIDNWAITLGKQRQLISEYYLRDAINQVLKGGKVKVSKTRAIGCIIE